MVWELEMMIMSNKPGKIKNMVKVCPDCGATNEVFDPNCTTCMRDLSDVDPIDEVLLQVPIPGQSTLTAILSNLSLDGRQPTGMQVVIDAANGEYVLGRAHGSFNPDIDLKPMTVPFVSNDPNDPAFKKPQRGISRTHAVVVRDGDTLSLFRHPDANTKLPVKVNGNLVMGTDASAAVPLQNGDTIELGDIFIPGTKQKAPGVVLQVTIQ